MNKLTISMLISIALLSSANAQASDFDDITLQIMDADSVSHDVNNIDFSRPEINMHDAILPPEVASSYGTQFNADPSVGLDTDSGLDGNLPDDLPPNIPGDDIPVDSLDFPDDLDDVLPTEVDNGSGGEAPDFLPPILDGEPTTDFPGELPVR